MGFSGLKDEGSGSGRRCRAGYVGVGRKLVAMSLNTLASGQAEAKAMRIREALSMTRAATLSSRRRRVANSAAASAVALGMACWMRHIAGELRLVALDQVLGLAARAVERVVDMLGRSVLKRGNDIADVHTQRAGLDPGDDAAPTLPAFGAVAGLGIVAQDGVLALSALDRAGIGGRDDDRIGTQRGVGWQAEHVIDAVRLAERHDLGPPIVPVTTDGDVGIGPVPADMAHQAPDVAGSFGARRRLAGPQQHRHRAAGRSVVDVDRQEAARRQLRWPVERRL